MLQGGNMEPRINVITLGVKDLATAIRFYQDGLGWKRSEMSNDHISFFQLSNLIFALYPRELLAEDAEIGASGSGFSGFTIAHNVRNKSDVSTILSLAEKAGAKIVKPAQDVFWGGHSGYFADPDGYLWEIAWNPHWQLDSNGQAKLGK